jgi:dTDP-4-amino-4,6-dideoxygalactose transaminase
MADSKSKIPFLDLVTMHEELEPQLVSVFQSVLRTAGFVGGPLVEGFERDFAQFCGAKYCVGLSSGTDAVRFALMAAGVQPGDVVVTVPHTFIATTEAITQAGARIEFVDIDARTYCMDPSKLQAYLETRCAFDPNTRKLIHREFNAPVTAIVPVHLYGQVADMDPIVELAERYGLIVVEDACQAHGAEYFSKKQNRWLKAGSIGQAAAFSFYPGKNLGACGEGGAATTNSEPMAQKMRMLRDHGQAKKYYHDMEGYNGRLDSVQAGILGVKLSKLSRWNEQRRECARLYQELLAPLAGSITLPFEPAYSKAVYHLYVVRTSQRGELQEQLTQAGVGTGIHYPIPLHLQKAYAAMNHKPGDFPVCEQVAAECLSLPMYPGLQAYQQRNIAEMIAEFAAVRLSN